MVLGPIDSTSVVVATASGSPAASAGMFQIIQCVVTFASDWSLSIISARLLAPSGTPDHSNRGDVSGYVSVPVVALAGRTCPPRGAYPRNCAPWECA